MRMVNAAAVNIHRTVGFCFWQPLRHVCLWFELQVRYRTARSTMQKERERERESETRPRRACLSPKFEARLKDEQVSPASGHDEECPERIRDATRDIIL